MPHYRLYFLDASRHIKRAVDLDCRDDGAALEQVRKYGVGSAIELWCGSRRVELSAE